MEQWPAATLHIHPMTMDIQLLYQPLGVVNAVTRWISEEAIQIDTGRIVLQRLSEVEITFPHHRHELTTYHRLLAHVSHRHEGTTTLRLLRCSRDAHRALHALINNQR